ncbi:MAG TPA: DUF6600 domain-containing protein [Dehalococcoidia bacterium]|nr:DUF6600 domain-containing protein [Dehalococcoidia bacterium]
MKILKTVMLVVVLLLVPVYALSANLGYMRISLIEGDVQIKTPDAGDWGYASINTPLAEGDQVWAPQGGRVELQLNSGTYIRLSENSALQILSMDKDSSQFYLSQGYAYVYYGAPGGSVIQVDTPDASTRAFDNAVFRIDMSEQYTDVAVYKGYVETENRVGRTRINAGQMVSLGQNTNGELAPMGPSDDWETWNKTRNDRIFARRGASSGYLPAELSAYSYDFDNNGRWVNVPEYGNVWTPTIGIGVSWSPYRNGRWIWRGGDYVWVGSEPWGWAPYHYGRWSFGVNLGWFWVPPIAREVYWSPGYVGWVRTSDYVAWVPLAPGETYYGRGNYGRNSVNITNVNIKQVNITNVYKNVYVNNGATVVNRNTFATASPRIAAVNQSVIQQKIFTRNNISIGTPAIKPTRASYFSSARSVPAAKRPPQAVRNVQIPQLKQSRPFIKEADKSVLNPGIKPAPLPVNTVTTPRTPGKGKPIIQQVKPAATVKPTAPEGRPTGRGQQPQVKPVVKKPTAPEGGPTGRGQQQQVKPAERVKPSGPAASPTDRGGKQQVKPAVKKPVAPEVGPTGRGQQQQVKPAEKKAVAPEGSREKKDKKKPAGLKESPQEDIKKQGEEEPERF